VGNVKLSMPPAVWIVATARATAVQPEPQQYSQSQSSTATAKATQPEPLQHSYSQPQQHSQSPPQEHICSTACSTHSITPGTTHLAAHDVPQTVRGQQQQLVLVVAAQPCDLQRRRAAVVCGVEQLWHRLQYPVLAHAVMHWCVWQVQQFTSAAEQGPGSAGSGRMQGQPYRR
jgi:hypothetical protein